MSVRVSILFLLALLSAGLTSMSAQRTGPQGPAVSTSPDLQAAIFAAPPFSTINVDDFGDRVWRGIEIDRPLLIVGGKFGHGSNAWPQAIVVRKRGPAGRVVFKGIELEALYPAQLAPGIPSIESQPWPIDVYPLEFIQCRLVAAGSQSVAVYSPGRVSFYGSRVFGGRSESDDGEACFRVTGRPAAMAGELVCVQSAMIGGDAGLATYASWCGGEANPVGAPAVVAFQRLYLKQGLLQGGFGQEWTNLSLESVRGPRYEAPGVTMLP